MVVIEPGRPPTPVGTAEPAVVVPDPGAWALWGEDLAARGLVPAATPAAASVLAVPHTVPHGLVSAVRSAWEEMPPPRRVVELEAPHLAGVPAAEVLEDPADGGHDHDDGGHEHDHAHDGGHDHEDMMEITGEPSRDGLVMESITLEHGPLAPGLPGGLVLEIELDGDVVCSCTARASLRAGGPTGEPAAGWVPDPRVAAAWTVALRAGRGDPLPAQAAVVALECERALSHLTWLAGFATVLGWEELAGRADDAAAPLIAGRREPARWLDGRAAAPDVTASETAIESAATRARRLLALLEDSRRLAARARGRAVVPREEAEAHGLAGPNARASGLRTDARDGDRVYGALGFEPRTQEGGDVEARVLQRAGEAVDALELASGAIERRSALDTAQGPLEVEAARGPLRVASRTPGAPPAVSAPGSAAARAIAGGRSIGYEWASALTAVASFDLSPWEVSG